MARKSAAEAALTKQKIADTIVALTVKEGFDSVSYTRLSRETGVSRSGIANHFPDKRSMIEAFQGQIFGIFTKYLDLSSRESFMASWLKALSHDEFRNILLLIFIHMGTSINGDMNLKAVNGVNRLMGFIEGSLGDEGIEVLELLLGKTLLNVVLRNSAAVG
ncbi:TetR family transcriptional regulator [Sinobacterium caligoides]|uniref:TetR family transcriptional regulator n=1 Tax=Sinobacterium caligoides TaxID=933926 RepID=A0A3N2DPV1_9GAMM|nr:TetR family transcriptional regulator [Sinobacterium caligoides]ROS01861.1 TetR family transcriptional regulator [Sinobacterium caligoides]